MAKIIRKLNSQERTQDVAAGTINAFSTGYIPGLKLGFDKRGVQFTLRGVGAQAKYSFQVALSEAEWTKLKKTLDGMLHGKDAKSRGTGSVASTQAKGVRRRSG